MEQKSGVVTFYFEDDVSQTVEATLTLDRTELELLFEFNFTERWTGWKMREGHYEMTCKETNGKGLFHYIPDEKVLHGFWTEQGNKKGMLRFEEIKT